MAVTAPGPPTTSLDEGRFEIRPRAEHEPGGPADHEDERGPGPDRAVRIDAGGVTLEGTLSLPAGTEGVVLFAHGSGSSRFSPRNQHVARVLREAQVGTLLFDLLTPAEEAVDARTARLRFDIALLARRVVDAIDWLAQDPATRRLHIGCFGASTGAAAALIAAAQRAETVGAVVSRGGRPDLAGPALPQIRAPTLLIVGGEDIEVLALNRRALAQIPAYERELAVIPGAGHLFEEPGALAEVGRLAASWFRSHLSGPGA